MGTMSISAVIAGVLYSGDCTIDEDLLRQFLWTFTVQFSMTSVLKCQ